MKRVVRSALVGACVMALAGTAITDGTYKIERLDLWLTDAGEALQGNAPERDVERNHRHDCVVSCSD